LTTPYSKHELNEGKKLLKKLRDRATARPLTPEKLAEIELFEATASERAKQTMHTWRAANMKSVVVYQENSGWFGDVIFHQGALHQGVDYDVLGTSVSTPRATMREAELDAEGIVWMILARELRNTTSTGSEVLTHTIEDQPMPRMPDHTDPVCDQMAEEFMLAIEPIKHLMPPEEMLEIAAATVGMACLRFDDPDGSAKIVHKLLLDGIVRGQEILERRRLPRPNRKVPAIDAPQAGSSAAHDALGTAFLAVMMKHRDEGDLDDIIQACVVVISTYCCHFDDPVAMATLLHQHMLAHMEHSRKLGLDGKQKVVH
jgi:hypothetical protein